MKKKILWAMAAAAVLAIGAGISSYAIPNCWQICDSGGCSFFCMSWGSSCYSYSETCIGDQGYCRYVCWNGNVYYSICHKDCGGTSVGGSPVFRKKIPVQQIADPEGGE
jgi:hypothetical protein